MKYKLLKSRFRSKNGKFNLKTKIHATTTRGHCFRYSHNVRKIDFFNMLSVRFEIQIFEVRKRETLTVEISVWIKKWQIHFFFKNCLIAPMHGNFSFRCKLKMCKADCFKLISVRFEKTNFWSTKNWETKGCNPDIGEKNRKKNF